VDHLEIYQENVVQKVGGRWALVSRKTHRPLAYWRGTGKPPAWWVERQEQRIQYFKHAHETPNPDVVPKEDESESGGGTAFFVIAGLAIFGGAGYLLYKLSQNLPTVAPLDFKWPNDAGKSGTIKVGQAVNITLPPANGSTGYHWAFASGDTSIVRPLFDPSLNGGTFAFQGQSAGTTTLVFNYLSATNQAVDAFQITVTVK